MWGGKLMLTRERWTFARKQLHIRRMHKSILIWCALFIGMLGTPAVACRVNTPSAQVSVIHPQIPANLPTDVFVAHVQFERPDGGWDELFRGARARVTRVIQGDYLGSEIIIRDLVEPNDVRITCYDPIGFGGSGYIVGKPVGYENGVPVIQPTFLDRAV